MGKLNTDCTLSLCMIVKNEAETLGRCLESVKNVCDQIVIVDTGSKDDTVAVAQSFGAEVHHFDWIDDFSAARNESIKYAKGDWVLWMDADEWMDPASIEHLQKILQKPTQPMIYLVTIRSLKDQGKNFHDSDAHRLFTNHHQIRFSGRIHEQISKSAFRIKAREAVSNILLHHTGYDLGEDADLRKLQRNQPLLEQLVLEEPNNAYAFFWLAQNLSQQDQNELAIKYLEHSLKMKQFPKSFLCSALNICAQLYFRTGKPAKALEYARKSQRLVPMQFGALYVQYLVVSSGSQVDELVPLLRKMHHNAVYLQTHPKQISTDTVAPPASILVSLGDALLKQGKLSDALQTYLESYKSLPDRETLKKIITLAQQLNNLDILDEVLKRALELDNSDPELLDIYALVNLKMNRMETALELYLRLAEQVPDNQKIQERIAAVHAKMGNIEQAKEILMNLSRNDQ